MLRRSWRLLSGGTTSGPFDPYKILGLEPNVSKEEIKRAYHRLALRFHPDGGPEGNAERFAAVNEAYEAVKDGKWKPSGEAHSVTRQGNNMHGWDPSMRMYVYEKPGSTTENYVTGHTQTLLRLCMVWCFLFVVVRVFLLWCFPYYRAERPDSSVSDEQSVGINSVHSENDDANWKLNFKSQVVPSDEVHTSHAVDPLSRRFL